MTSQNRLDELLLTNLSNLAPDQWPGGDGFTQQDVLREYPTMAAKSLVPGQDTLHRLHPDLADELAQFFAARTSQPRPRRRVRPHATRRRCRHAPTGGR